MIEVGAARPSVEDYSHSPAARVTDAVAAPTYDLRPWTADDTRTLWAWIEQDAELWQQWDLKGEPSLVGLTVQIVSLMADPHARLCAVTRDDATVGMAALTRIQSDGSAFCHLVIAPQERGIGRQVSKALLAYAFRVLRITALVAQVRTDNPRAKAFAVSLGFQPMPYDFLILGN